MEVSSKTRRPFVMEKHVKRRIASFIASGVILAAAVVLGFADVENFWVPVVPGIMISAFASCLILNNNFIPDMVLEIFSWGFVRMPGLIFTLDLDGIIWLLTVKLLFWVLGILLALLAGGLALFLGTLISVFVYPFAIIKNFKKPYESETI